MLLLAEWIIRRALLVYICAALALACFLTFTTGLLDEYRLIDDGKTANGVVVQPSCDQHSSFSYRFELAGASYQGRSTSHPCGQISRGDEVVVHYLPGRPEVSMVGDPRARFVNDATATGMATAMMPAIFLLIFWAKRRDLRKQQGGS